MSFERIVAPLTQGNINNSSVRLRQKDLEFFPSDAIGPPNKAQGEGALLTLRLSGLSEDIKTDIAGDKKIVRCRGPWRGFFDRYRLVAGDSVVFERLSEYEYRVTPDPGKPA